MAVSTTDLFRAVLCLIKIVDRSKHIQVLAEIACRRPLLLHPGRPLRESCRLSVDRPSHRPVYAVALSPQSIRMHFNSLPDVNYPTPIDARHQGPKVTVTAALCLCFAAVVLATRLLIRWPWLKLFGLDDGAAMVASVGVSKLNCRD